MATTQAVEFDGVNASITIQRRSPSVVLVTIAGRDAGEHGDGPFVELEKELGRGPFSLFIDARATQGASIDVSKLWAQWLRKNRDRLHRIHMLTGSRFVQLTADFVRRFAELGDAMLIYTDPNPFEEMLELATVRERENADRTVKLGRPD